MPKRKLTDAAVQRINAPKGARVEYFDATLPGFALRVSGPNSQSPTGRKSWCLYYRFRGQQKRLTFEPVYPALGLADARRKAGDALAMLPGTDPAAVKIAAKQAIEADSLDKIVAQYLDALASEPSRRAKRKRSPRYVQETKRNFDNHVLPRWRNRNINEITKREVNDLLDAVAREGSNVKCDDGTKKHVAGGPIAANRVQATLSALFNWSITRGILEGNPCRLVASRGEERARERVLSDDEIRLLWPYFEKRGYPFGNLFQLALLTGQRREEIAGMLWAEIDEAERTWTLSAKRTKAKRPHVVPLSDPALAILKTAREKVEALAKAAKRAPSAFVLTTTLESHVSGYSGSKARLDKAVAVARDKAKLKPLEPWAIHDLRRTLATKLAELGIARFTVARVLNHADRSVTGEHYDKHDYLTDKRNALDAWAKRLEAILTGAPANVVPAEELSKRRKARKRA